MTAASSSGPAKSVPRAGELRRGIAAAVGARGYSLVAGLGVLLITSRALGPTGRGEIAAAITWASLFSTIGYLSLGQVALHRAAGEDGLDWLRPVLGALVRIAASVAVLGWAVALISYGLTDGRLYGDLPPALFALGMIMLPFLVWEQYGSLLLTAVDRLSIYNRAQIIGRTAGLVATLILVPGLQFGAAGALSAAVLAQAVIALGGTRHLRSLAVGGGRSDARTVRELVKGGAKLHLNAVGTFLFANSSILFVQYYRGATETGYFHVAVQLVTVAMIVPQAVSMVLYTEVARHGPDGAWPSTRRFLWVTSVAMGVLALVAALLAPFVIPVLLGESFRPAVPVFQLLGLTLIGQTFSTIMAGQWIGRGMFWQASSVTVAVGLLNLGACAILVPRYGMFGAAWALVGIFTVSILGNGIFALLIERGAQVVRPATGAPVAAEGVVEHPGGML